MNQKLILSLLLSTILSSCALFSSDSSDTNPEPTAIQNCGKPLQDAQDYLSQIKIAFANNDACTAGNLQIEYYNMAQQHLSCFPGSTKGDYTLFKVLDQLDTSIEPIPPECQASRAKVSANSQKIKSALLQNDGCTAGKVEFETLDIVKANSSCFPKDEQSLDNMIDAIEQYKNKQAEAQDN